MRLTLVTAGETAARSNPRMRVARRVGSSELCGLRLLLAEDNPDIRLSTTALLTHLGAEVVEAADGLEAIDLCTREVFDVVLMDVRMPRLDGLEATRALRKQGVGVPIVALTADAVQEHREECLAAGCSAHVAKPIDADRLVALIHEMARKSRFVIVDHEP